MTPDLADPAPIVAVIGDIGGHATELAGALQQIGVDAATGHMPDHVARVVQVGDLIDCGPDSAEAVEIAARCMDANPDRWTQLVGNHEAAILGGPRFQPFGETAPPTVQSRIRDMWDQGRLHIATALDQPPLGPTLITHAGLTRDVWLAIGSPHDLAEAAAILDGAARTDPELVYRPGRLLGGEKIDLAAGPLWADPRHELLASWLGHQMPFSQIHGHAAAWSWSRPASRPSLPRRTWLDRRRRHSWIPIGDRWIVGIDPCLGRYGGAQWDCLCL